MNPLRYNGRSFLAWHYKHFGAARTLSAGVRLLSEPRAVPVYNSAVVRSPTFVRPGTADLRVYEEIFLDREYDLALGEPKFIIDAGAHIGLASLFFAERYPQATIAALEPEPDNFALLRKNCLPYPSVHPINAGLWTHETYLKIENPGADTWSFRVVEADSGIRAVSIQDLMAQFGKVEIDVLKIDIEGAEREILRESGAWLGKVRTIIIELHDRYRPGCTAALEEAIQDLNFCRARSGESVVLQRTIEA
jgi:FkbM family methyltransferase